MAETITTAIRSGVERVRRKWNMNHWPSHDSTSILSWKSRGIATFIVLLVGACDFWQKRCFWNARDGISYLNLGHAFCEGRWYDFVNSYWSPGLLVLLGTAEYYSGANAPRTFAIFNLALFATFVLAWFSALFFFQELMRFRAVRRQRDTQLTTILNQ